MDSRLRAHAKDPSYAPGGATARQAAFDPRMQPDQLQPAEIEAHAQWNLARRKLFPGLPSYAALLSAPFQVFVPDADTPMLLIPSNTRRLWFTVIAPNFTIGLALSYFSFGYPSPQRSPYGGGTGVYAWGLPLTATFFPPEDNFIQYHPANSVAAIDDIYVTISSLVHPPKEGSFIGFEASYALNERNLQHDRA